MPRLAAELTYVNGRFERDVVIEYDDVSGTITGVAHGIPVTATERLAGRAIMPGFVNGHSHAFQRAIRGKTQWRPVKAPPSDFWSWREAMYESLLAMSPEDVYSVSRDCYREMLRAGYTTVGEFHYLQRDEDGNAYDNPLELHQAVLAAARDTGIRIVLINTAYATGGVARPLMPLQRRFNTPDLDEFLAQCDALRTHVGDDPMVSVGVAPHSIRAVPREWIKPIHDWAKRAGVPIHMHVSEQMAEVDACTGEYGRRPVELLNDLGVLDSSFTAIHATHIAVHEVALLARSRATVCACPSTERDLGDGFLQATSLHGAGAHIAIGTDSQTIIDPFEELRLIEYHERLRKNERVLLAHVENDRATVAPSLLRYGTVQGARALQVASGEIAEGRNADFIAVDLDHMQLAGWTDDSLDAMLVLSASAHAVITDTWVGGKRVAGV